MSTLVLVHVVISLDRYRRRTGRDVRDARLQPHVGADGDLPDHHHPHQRHRPDHPAVDIGQIPAVAAISILSLVLLAIACLALYSKNLSGGWRWIYVVTALVSLYLNCFVLVIQSFLKIPVLSALAPASRHRDRCSARFSSSCWRSSPS
jgi:hypothetical protein